MRPVDVFLVFGLLNARAEGYETMAVRNYSHAGGVGTQAYRYGQYAIGEYNPVFDSQTE